MKIAQVSPLIECVPPRGYGGTERIVGYLTEELVRQGHQVTLFATADSSTSAELVPCADGALRLCENPLPHHLLMLDEVRRRADGFDVLHFHIDLLHFPLAREFAGRTVTTLHGRLDLPGLRSFYAAFRDMPLVSISLDQRRPLPDGLCWTANVPHGLPRDLLRFKPDPRLDYLAFLGRISPEKGPDKAIVIAARSGIPLKLAAKVDPEDEQYWRETIEPMIRGNPDVEFVGEIGETEKAEFLGNALALLFPIDWPEPFGLVMIEAMACGTPVIAFPRGSVPEVIEPGITGFIVSTANEAAAAVAEVAMIDRRRVRARFEERYAVERMVADYLDVYARLPGVWRAPGRAADSAQRARLSGTA